MMRKWWVGLLCMIGCLYANGIDDPAELEEYVAAFPYEEYVVCSVPRQGSFYVEPKLNDYVKNRIRKGLTWEGHILNVIKKYAKPGTTVVNIGSHIGTFVVPLSWAVGQNGTVYAFEPQRKIYRELLKNLELNHISNVKPYRMAIGDREQIIQMDKKTIPGSEASTKIGKGGDFAEMRTLDSFQIENISFMLIDVEETEDQVIDGMAETVLRNMPVICIEIQGNYAPPNIPPHIRAKIKHTKKKLEALGYRVSLLHHHDYIAMPIKS
jgi:FkbM family methyltransferase